MSKDMEKGRTGETERGRKGEREKGSGRLRTTGRIRTFESEEEFRREKSKRSRRAFLTGGVAMLAGIGGWEWLTSREQENGIGWPFRRVLETNERLVRDAFSDQRLAETFPLSMAVEPRVNGRLGLMSPLDAATWTLMVRGLAQTPEIAALQAQQAANQTNADDDDDAITLTMDDIRKLPRTEMVTELRCVEGWTVIVHWAGVRFADFAAKYLPATRSGKASSLDNQSDLLPYVALETPDGTYFVGIDLASALHPQTLLCYEMNGRPLTPDHGAPLRLVTPSKYGIKNIKRIGSITFTDERPKDYWGERGYDWYAGL